MITQEFLHFGEIFSQFFFFFAMGWEVKGNHPNGTQIAKLYTKLKKIGFAFSYTLMGHKQNDQYYKGLHIITVQHYTVDVTPGLTRF